MFVTIEDDNKNITNQDDIDFCFTLLKSILNHNDPIELIIQGIKERKINLHVSKQLLIDPYRTSRIKSPDMIITSDILSKSVLLKTILSLMFEAIRMIHAGLRVNGDYIKVINYYDSYGDLRFPMMLFMIRVIQEDGSYRPLGPFRWKMEYLSLFDLFGPYMLLMFEDEYI